MAFVEISPAIEIFVSGLARVERLGNNIRCVYFVQQIGMDGEIEDNINLRIIMPNEAVAPGIEKKIIALGSRLILPLTAGALMIS